MNVQTRKIYTSQKSGLQIDDTTTSSTKTYSSEKIKALLSDVVQEENRLQGNIVEFGANGIKNSGKKVSDFANALHTHNASNIPTDTANLGGVLPSTLDSVQKVIDWIDDNIGFGGQILIGTSVPLNSSGKQGDVYIRSNGNIYQKNAGGTWTDTGVNIQGPVGPQGIQGVQGPNAPNLQFQYSSDNSSFHPTFTTGDKYIRFSNDGGATWVSGIKFVGNDGLGSGDMLMSTYDTTGNGIVDNAEKLGGQSPSYYQVALGFTAEDVGNKSTSMTGNTSSNTKYLTAKAIYDWVTSLTTSSISDSFDKRYVTDAQLSILNSTSGTNTGDQDLSGFYSKSEVRAISLYNSLIFS